MGIKKSFCFLINSLAGGGAERVLIRILSFLKPKKVFLLEREINYPVDESLVEILSKHSIRTNPILKTLYIPLYALRLSSKLENSSTVVSFLERANFVNVLSKSFKKHKAIISVRMDQESGHKGLRKLNSLLIKIFYPRADLVIAVSKGVKESLIRLGVPEEKIKVIYNPYPIEEIQGLTKEPLYEYEVIFKNPVLITAGRLTKQKGQWHLLRIFKKLKEEFPELKLVILGEGELKEYLFKLSQTLGLKTFVWDRDKLSEDFDVYFLGFQKNPFKFIGRAELFVFPSLWEGFPNALVEAMACGVPVVSSDCRSGPREILAPDRDFRIETQEPEFAEYGVLMPVFEVKFKKADEPLEEKEIMWAETLRRLLIDDKLRAHYSQRALERAEDFRIEKIIEEWRWVLES
ncbi:glycosyltransferase [Thermodesulfovibrio sp. 3907-1M]|uniref:Glycosyltransferase n=1 Tax=Thermodesulfovibrio autotrophicus TaxID=3118333 RepID=A0AAU8GWD1_9BACT